MAEVKYNKWTVLRAGKSSLFWWCRCECGREKEVNKKNVKAGLSKSCGECPNNRTKHGMADTKTYQAWRNMHARCENPKNISYPNYGARGIKVCERWSGKNGFINFLEDMKECPDKHLSVDRINNDGHYEPGNCKWSTRSEQQRHKTTTKYYDYDNEDGLGIQSLCASEWADKWNMTLKTFSTRMSRGWSMDRIKKEPVGPPRGASAYPKTQEEVTESKEAE